MEPDVAPRTAHADDSEWHALVAGRMSRRRLLTGAAAAGVAAAVPLHLSMGRAAAATSATVATVRPTTADRLVLPRGFRADLIAPWGSAIGGGLTAGFNHDWIGYYPIDLLDRGMDLDAPHLGYLPRRASSRDGILVVNHEYTNPLFVSGYAGTGPKTPQQVAAEQAAVGASVMRVRRDGTGVWSVDASDATYARRLDATTPCVMTGPAASIDGGPGVVGTLANCSGGATPWGTGLSCEENFQSYPQPAPAGDGWDPAVYGRRHYGWVVEVDPFSPASPPRKHTAMGRFRHENVAIAVGPDRTVVAYMGDDLADSCVYKFVADRRLGPATSRDANLGILESGRLYVADFGNAAWVLLDYATQAKLRDARTPDGTPVFASQAEVLADARAAALLVGGTPVDRPEDIEINPLDGSVFVALTNNTGHGNFHGQIVRIAEEGGDPSATSFDWSIFAVGGPQSGFSSPDNLIFDGSGSLWMVTDISSARVGRGIYSFQGNNGLFLLPIRGRDAGTAYQFASGPVDCELTGPAWTPDGGTLFLSVQHPGELSTSVGSPTSRWPNGGDDVPRPSCVAITGPWAGWRRGR